MSIDQKHDSPAQNRKMTRIKKCARYVLYGNGINMIRGVPEKLKIRPSSAKFFLSSLHPKNPKKNPKKIRKKVMEGGEILEINSVSRI